MKIKTFLMVLLICLTSSGTASAMNQCRIHTLEDSDWNSQNAVDIQERAREQAEIFADSLKRNQIFITFDADPGLWNVPYYFLDKPKTEKVSYLMALSFADYMQTVQFLFRLPGRPTGTYTKFNGLKINRSLVDAAYYANLQTPDEKRQYLLQTQPWAFETITVYERFAEGNPLLGPRPSRKKLLAFGIAGVTLTAILSAWLPEPWSGLILNSVLYSERLNVENNNSFLASGYHAGPIPIVLTFNF